jgi:ribose transport system ATP-binding protein
MMVGRVAEEVFYDEERQRGSGGEVVLSVEGLTKVGGFTDVSFELHAGEVIGVGGVVGSGKSDLGKALAECGREAEGKIELFGKVLKGGGPREAIRAEIGYVPPERHVEGIVGLLSVAQNIALPRTGSMIRTPYVSASQERRTARTAVKELNIKTHSVDTPLDQLSGGNQQKVILARWTSLRSKVLVLDNPTNGIDVGAKAEIYKLIRNLTVDGVAVLLFDDDLLELIGLSDKILIMKDGSVKATFESPANGKPDETEIVAHMV